jgi:soluble lytic murein transglycosylase
MGLFRFNSNRLLGGLVFFAVATFIPCASVAAEGLSAEDTRLSRAAFDAMEKEDWEGVRRLAAKIQDPVAAKLIFWMDIVRVGTKAPFEEIARFISTNPDWPEQSRLQRRAEEAMTDETPPKDILAWFGEGRKPVSATGSFRYGSALWRNGNKEHGREVLRKAWIEGNFPRHLEKEFYRRYRKLLSANDHVERLDRLLWEGHNGSARRMLWKVSSKHRLLGEARFLLRQMKGNVDRAIAKVPANLKKDQGLVYERLRWRRRKGHDLSAIELLKGLSEYPERARVWWRERSILARRLLRAGAALKAYRVASQHGLSSQNGTAKGVEYAQAEWLSGWIALQFLSDHEGALNHFVRMFGMVKSSISQARGAYWAARATEAMGQSEKAVVWDRIAAMHSTTYYGQLSAERLSPGTRLAFPGFIKPSAEEAVAFARHEMMRVVEVLSAIGKKEEMGTFIMALYKAKETAEWRALAVALAYNHGRQDTAIILAKKSAQRGHVLVAGVYPSVSLPKSGSGMSAAEIPLVLSIIRQESAFDPTSTSRAGARGLMQIMPRTALLTAKKFKKPYSRERLLNDPYYNLELGQAYLEMRLEEFGGSYPLTLAAYNAGPANAKRWMRTNGDPRNPEVDVVNWVEMIPYAETRNYVQRVMETLQVYRHLAKADTPLSIGEDLRR